MVARIGTSGWVYPHWRERFYPRGLPQTRWLSHYAETFSAVEVNATFYRLPDRTVVRHWRDQVPASFRFALKASGYITHVRRLEGCGEALARFFKATEELGAKRGPTLFQLPPTLKADRDRLVTFLQLLPGRAEHVFEFRHPSWFQDATRELLDEHGAAFCIHDWRGIACPDWKTGGLAYFRFHGPPDGQRSPRYGTGALRKFARSIGERSAQGRPVYAFFNNDAEGAALADAADVIKYSQSTDAALEIGQRKRQRADR